MENFIRSFILLMILITCNLNSFSAVITAKLLGGNWHSTSTWDLGRIPGCGDNVVIPIGVTVNITSNVDFTGVGCAATAIDVMGKIIFDNGKKIKLNEGSCISISVTGSIFASGSGGGASEKIEIANVVLWKASDGNLLGSILPDGINLGCGVILPVELISFSVEYMNEKAKILFSTNSERDLDYFVVERSKDANFWQEVEIIKAAGNTSSITEYSCKDIDPFLGTSYYRLLSVNIDGTKDTLYILSSEFSSFNYLMYPVPVNKLMFVEGNKLKSSSITVYNSVGQIIEVNNTVISDRLCYNFDGIPNGIYFIKIKNENVQKTKRVVVSH